MDLVYLQSESSLKGKSLAEKPNMTSIPIENDLNWGQSDVLGTPSLSLNTIETGRPRFNDIFFKMLARFCKITQSVNRAFSMDSLMELKILEAQQRSEKYQKFWRIADAEIANIRARLYTERDNERIFSIAKLAKELL